MTTIDIDVSITADQLQALIDEAPSGAILRFAAGHYEFDDALLVSRSDISLVGAGAGETVLTFSDWALSRNDHAIRLDGTQKTFTGELAADISEDSRQLTLAEGHDLRVGDTLRLWQDNDDAFFDEIGDTTWRKGQYAELRTSMARIESVDGDTITLDRGVHFAFEAGKTQVARMETVDNVTLEGFSVEFELGTPEPGVFENTLEVLTGYNAVLLTGTVDTRLSDIEVNNGPSTAFRFSRTLDPTAEDLDAHGAFNKGSGGNGYAYELHESYDGQFTGLEDSGMRHSLLFASWRSSVGNEAEIAFTDRDINFHGGQDHDNSVHVLRSIRDPQADELSPALYVNEAGASFGAPTDPEANEVFVDYLIGSRRDDEVQGADDGVYLDGGLGHDQLLGGAGDDILQGGPGADWNDGTDTLDGGQGTDTARYPGDFADHDIAVSENGVIITGQGSQDILTDMEFAVFGDGTTLHLASGNTFRGSALELPSAEEILAGGGKTPALLEDAAELLVTGNITSHWSSGYVAEFFVENISDDDIVDPELGFALPAEIDTLWNGEIIEGTDGYRVRDDDGHTLAPGEAWRFAFKADGEDSLPAEMTARDNEGQPRDVQVLGLGNTAIEEVAG